MTETFRGLPQKEDRMPDNEHVPTHIPHLFVQI